MTVPLDPITTGHLVTLPDDCQGFDCNEPLTQSMAGAFAAHGYRYAIRYVPRLVAHANDITREEVGHILGAGLGLMLVQHVESAESWTPSHQKGAGYGAGAVQHAQGVGMPPGAMVALDLEGVAVGSDAEIIIDYCNVWYDVVSSAGFKPILYVGWHSGLTGQQLYHALRFSAYWSAYNLNGDQYPAIRGVCMKQRAAKAADTPAGITVEFDTNTSQTDARGGQAVIFAPAGWTP